MVLRNIANNKEKIFKLNTIDPTQWDTDNTVTVTLSFSLSGVIAGIYDVIFNMPDNRDQNKDNYLSKQDKAYRILFSNDNKVVDLNERINKISTVTVT